VVLLNTFLASDLYFFRLLSQPVSKSSIGGGFRWREASTLVDNHRGYETVVKCDGTTLFGVDAKTRKLIWFGVSIAHNAKRTLKVEIWATHVILTPRNTVTRVGRDGSKPRAPLVYRAFGHLKKILQQSLKLFNPLGDFIELLCTSTQTEDDTNVRIISTDQTMCKMLFSYKYW